MVLMERETDIARQGASCNTKHMRHTFTTTTRE